MNPPNCVICFPVRDGPFVVVFPQLMCTSEGKNLMNLSLSRWQRCLGNFSCLVWMWFEIQNLAGESRGQVKYIFRINQNTHKKLNQKKGKEKHYYIDKAFSLIFSPERTTATSSLLSKLNNKIDSGLELSLVEGLVWLPSPSPSPFSVALTMLSVSSLRAGQHPSSTICTDTFFMRWFSYLFLQHRKYFALPRMLTNSISNEILDMFWLSYLWQLECYLRSGLLKILIRWATGMCTQSIISSSCVCLPRWQYCLRESEHTHSAVIIIVINITLVIIVIN